MMAADIISASSARSLPRRSILLAVCVKLLIWMIVTCARMNTLKIEYKKAIRFLKKGLQYAWNMKDTDSELLSFYDWLGQGFY